MFFCYLTNTLLGALMAWSGRRFPGAWLWVGALALLTLGTFLDAAAPVLPPWWPLVVGNTAYVASCVLNVHSAWLFRTTRPFPRELYLVILAEFLSFLLLADQAYWLRSAVFSGWMALGALAVALVLLWHIDRVLRMPTLLTAFPFLILALSSLVRVGLLLALGAPEAGSSVATVNVWYVTGAILLSVIMLFGYFMMTETRAELALAQKDEEIRARNKKLSESNRSKDLFFSIIAHDLRGPIGGAARYVRKHLLGKMTGLEAKYTEVETLASALEKTNDFLEKLLWWSRSQLEDWSPARVPVDLARVFDQALSINRSAADLKEISLVLDPGPYPRPLADPESVQLILGNLLSNAVKFSLPGLTVKIHVVEEGGGCKITVADEGVGMDQATLDRLFRIEDKLTTHGTSGERGSGLGLLLVRSLAERNLGGVTIESEPGLGTRATLWLPLASPPPGPW